MSRFANICFVVLLGILSFGLLITTGCGNKNVGAAGPGPDTTSIPPWFLNPPEDPNYLYATATSDSKDMQNAIEEAAMAARTEIGNVIGTKIGGLFKRFIEEVGGEDDAQLNSMTTNVSKAVVSELIRGAQIKKKEVQRESVHWRAYVLVEMPLGEANAALMSEIKKNDAMWTRFRSSQSHQELNAEIEKYEKWKKEQGGQ